MGGEGALARLSGPALRIQPDGRLVRLLRDGHSRAFDEIVRRYRRPLVAFAAGYVPSDRAEDVVQDGLTSAYSALREGEAEIALRPWLYTIVRNRALNDLRDTREHAELDEEFDGVPPPPDVLERRERFRGLVSELRHLPEAQREAIVKRELEGSSHEQIAAELEISPGAVRQLIYRARITLRNGVGLLLPLPLLRGLLEAEAARAAAAGGLAAGSAAAAAGGGAGTVAIKAGVALSVAAVAVGSGVALRDYDREGDQASAASRDGDGGGSEPRGAPPATGGGDLSLAKRGTGASSRSGGPRSGSSDSGSGSSGSARSSGPGSGGGSPGSSGSGTSGSDESDLDMSGSSDSGSGSSGSSGPGSGDLVPEVELEPEIEADNSGPGSSGSGSSESSGSGSSGSTDLGSSGSGSSGSGSSRHSSGSGSSGTEPDYGSS